MKTRLTALCLSVLLALLSGCGGYRVPSNWPAPVGPPSRTPAEPQASEAETSAPGISLAEYRAMVSALNTRLADEAELLIRAGLYEYNWWGSYSDDPGGVDLDEMVELVMAWLAQHFDADADSIAAACRELIAAYADIVSANVDGEAPAEISGLVGGLVSAYYKLYTIVTEPSGTIQDFVPMLCSCTYSITTLSAELTAALETL